MALIKPVDRLTREDLEDFALWEPVPGDDEGRVRPVASRDVPDDSTYFVACDIESATQRRWLGWIRVSEGAVIDEAPTLVGDVAGGIEPDASHFPLEWQLRLPLAGEGALRVGTVEAPARSLQ
jgi:hypothetical protein